MAAPTATSYEHSMTNSEKVEDVDINPMSIPKTQIVDETENQDASDMAESTVPTIPPEEGMAGWLCVMGAFFILFCSLGFLNAVGVFQSYYQQHYLEDYSASGISWIFSFQLMLLWLPGLVFGRIVDTYGPGPVLYPCSILCILGLCMISLSTKYYQIFLAQGVAFGIGAGGVFSSTLICVGQWFVKRRGLATGVAATGSSLGGVIFPLMLDRLIDDIGFGGAVRYTALLVGVLLVFGCCFIRARLPRKRWNSKQSFVQMSLFKEPQFALFCAGSFFTTWALWMPLGFISDFGLAQGMSGELSLALVSIINATSIAGRLLPPYLSDVFGHLNVITLSGFAMGISILCLWLPFDFTRSLAGVLIFSLLYGFVSGAFVTLCMPCVAKTGPIETIGLRFGNFQVIMSLASLTGLPISGAIIARQGDTVFWGAQTFAVVSALVGASLTAASTLLLRQKSNTWKV